MNFLDYYYFCVPILKSKSGFYARKIFQIFYFFKTFLARTFKLVNWQVFIKCPIFRQKLDFCPSVYYKCLFLRRFFKQMSCFFSYCDNCDPFKITERKVKKKSFSSFLLRLFFSIWTLDCAAHDSCSTCRICVNDHSTIQNAGFFGSGKPNFLFLNPYKCFAINGIHTSQISNIFSGFIFGLRSKKIVSEASNFGHN